MSELTPGRWKKITDIYNQLADCPPEAWPQALSRLCGGDNELQRDVEHYRELEQKLERDRFLNSDSPRASISHTEISLADGEVLAGRYQVIKLIGCGGMADVYEVEDRELGNRRLALKVIRSNDTQMLERFRKEVELASKINHRNVCRVHDIGHDRRGPREITFLSMELIPGETMAERLSRKGKLDPSEWILVAGQLCSALHEAHQAQVLHRDFKPGNVMLVGSEEKIRAVVTDFGIARAMDSENAPSLARTAKHLIVGTWYYMSPEQKRGEELTAASDVYSLGLVLYEMLTEEKYALCPQLDRIPERLGNWRRAIQRCLEDDPAKRFGTAIEVLAALENPKPEPILKQTPSPPTPIWRLARILSIAAVLFFVLVVGWRLRTLIASSKSHIQLPADKRLAVLPPQANDQELEVRARTWSKTTIKALRQIRAPEGSFWVAPWDSVKEVHADDGDSAASEAGANLYTLITVKKDNGTIYFKIELRQVGSKLQPLTDEFPVVENSNVDFLLAQHIANLLGIPPPLPPSCSSVVPAACETYARGSSFLAQRDRSRIDLAIESFKQAIAQDPKFALPYADLTLAYALKYRSTHDPLVQAKAVQAYSQAINLDGTLPRAHVGLGLILQDMGSITDAIDQFKKALSLDPSDNDVRNLLSMVYLRIGNMEEGKRLLEEAIQQDPRYWSNYNDLGYLYYTRGEVPTAEIWFRQAVAHALDNTIANGVLASACICLGKYREAEEIANKVLAFKKSAIAYENLAMIYEHQHRYSDAANMLQQAAEHQPASDFYWLEYGDALRLEGKQNKAANAYREALKQAEESYKRNPSDRDVLGRLAFYHIKLGQKGEALRALSQALAITPNAPDPDLSLIAARVYELAGMRREALNVLRSVAHNQCVRTSVETIPDFVSLRSDREYSRMIASPEKK